MFCRSRSPGAIDFEARHSRRDASRGIFALTWGRLTASYPDIRQRVYRGMIDTRKTDQSLRKAALSEGLLVNIENWRLMTLETRVDAWVFPSERMTPLSKDNCWRRSMYPRLAKVGLGWANFLVMRRTHATLMKALGWMENWSPTSWAIASM
jgi:integrase